MATREVGKRERKEWSSEKRVVVNGYGLVEGNKRKKVKEREGGKSGL